MRSFITNEYGRFLVIHLSKGEKLLEGIMAAIQEHDVKNAVVVSGIGSLRKMEYHVIGHTEDNPLDVFRTVEKPIEIGAIQGLILDGVPHLHLICSEPDGDVHMGHLEEGCEVQYLVEIGIVEFTGLHIGRKADEFGVGYIAEL